MLQDKVSTVEEVRQQGFFQVLTPAQCLEQTDSGTSACILHPLAGGVPIAEAWQYLRLFGEQVMPGLRESWYLSGQFQARNFSDALL